MADRIKIMVASTVYGFQDQLSAICSTLTTMKYDVINSHIGTVKVNPKKSNLENCIAAVSECDAFLGIIRPYYGTGNIDEMNITFEEIKEAIRLDKPYWFLVHRDVTFMRQMIKKLYHLDSDGKKVFDIKVEKSSLFDSRTLEIYEYVIKHGSPLKTRTGNWAQEFYKLDEALRFVNTQYKDQSFIRSIIDGNYE